jgi:hypothetical protein
VVLWQVHDASVGRMIVEASRTNEIDQLIILCHYNELRAKMALVWCLDHGLIFLQLIKKDCRPAKACPAPINKALSQKIDSGRTFIKA